MAVSDFLGEIGKGLATTGRVVGTVAPELGKAVANEEAGYAPEIAKEKRQHQQNLEDAEIEAKSRELESQLEIGRKYGTLSPDDQQKYVDAITNLYSHPRHAATLMEKLRKAVHPNGSVYTPSSLSTLKNAVPDGGMAATDEANAERLAAARYHAKPATPQQQFFDAYAKKLGLEDSTQMTAEQWEQAFKDKKQSERNPVKWGMVHFGGNYYVRNPETNEMKFVGTDDNVTVTHSTQNIQVGDPPHLVQIPVTRFVSKVTQQPIVDADGNPYEAADETKAVTKGAVPTSATPNTPSASKPKGVGGILPKVKPVKPSVSTGAKKVDANSIPGVGNLPKGSRDLGLKGPTLLDRSNAAQYTKAAEDATAKGEAYENARKAMASGSTASSDQELIYSWVRANVQGAGRMTQAEFKQAAATGSLELRAQNWYNMTLTGKLAPELEQMMLADIKRSAETAQKTADDLRNSLGDTGGGEAIELTRDKNGKLVPK